MVSATPTQCTIVHDTDPTAFAEAVAEATEVVADVFEFDENARRKLDHILGVPGLYRRIVLLYRRGDTAVGYHFLTYQKVEVQGRTVCVCRSLAGFRAGSNDGGYRTFMDVIPVTLRVLAEVRMPLYLVTVSVTPMGYMPLACTTTKLYPSHAYDGDDFAPALLEATLESWGTACEVRDGVRVARNVRCRVPFKQRDGVPHPDIAFYLSHCPDFEDGVGLPICMPLTLRVLGGCALHYLSKRVQRTLRRLTLPELSPKTRQTGRTDR